MIFRKKMAKRCLAVLMAAVIGLNLVSCGKSKMGESYEGTLAAGESKIGSERVSLSFGDYPLSKDAQYKIAPVGNPPALEGAEIDAYSFEVDTEEEVLSVMALTLPYDDKALKGQSAEGNIAAAYYNEATSQWEPVAFEINEDQKTVTIYTDHLSVYGCFEVTDPNTKAAYAAYAIPIFATSKLMSSDANAIITTAANNGGTPGQDAIDAGLTVLDGVLSLSSAGVETTSHIAGLLGSGGGAAANSLLDDIGERLGTLGLLCSVAQVSSGMYSIYNGNTDAIFPCYANALKGSIGYTAGKMGAKLFSLAFLGVLAIEYSINSFATEALSGRKDIYQKAYALYYESPGAKRNAREWANILLKAREGAASTDKYKLRVEGLVDRYANEFWKDESVVAEYQSLAQGQGFTGGGGLNERIKEEISRDYKITLYKGILQEAFKLIAQKDAMNAEKAVLNELNAIKKELNKMCTLEFFDSTVNDKKPDSKYAGGKAALVLPDTVQDKDSWSVELGKGGEGRIQFTLLGYLMAGAPKEIELYEKGAEESDEPEKSIMFELKDINTKIDVGVEQIPLSELVGKYKGTLTIADVFVSDEILQRAKTDPLRFNNDTLGFEGDCDAELLAGLKEAVGHTSDLTIAIEAVDEAAGECRIIMRTIDEDGEGTDIPYLAIYKNGKFTTGEQGYVMEGFVTHLMLAAQKSPDNKISLNGTSSMSPQGNENDVKIELGIKAAKVE